MRAKERAPIGNTVIINLLDTCMVWRACMTYVLHDKKVSDTDFNPLFFG